MEGRQLPYSRHKAPLSPESRPWSQLARWPPIYAAQTSDPQPSFKTGLFSTKAFAESKYLGRNSITSLSARYTVRCTNLFSASSWVLRGTRNPRYKGDPPPPQIYNQI